jgi:hypothetical protein
MSQLQEHDAMVCRACDNEERASEGYPCEDCGTFICQICNLRGVTKCRKCQAKNLPMPKWLED